MVLAKGKAQGGEQLPHIYGVWQNDFNIAIPNGKDNTHISCYFASAYVNYLNNVAHRPATIEEVHDMRDRFVEKYGIPRVGSTVKVGLEKVAEYFGVNYEIFGYKSQEWRDALRAGKMVCNSMLVTEGFLQDWKQGKIIRYGYGTALGGHVVNLYRPKTTPYMINTQFEEANPIRQLGGRSQRNLLHGSRSGFIY